MTIKHTSRFHQARPAGFDGVFEWDFLLPAFAGTRIQPMDLDFVVERRGRFLVQETKASGVPLPQGQILTFERLLDTGIFTLFLVQGKTRDDVSALSICTHDIRIPDTTERMIDWRGLLHYTSRWFAWADNQKPPQMPVEKSNGKSPNKDTVEEWCRAYEKRHQEYWGEPAP